MKIAVFSTKPYDRRFLDAANESYGHEIKYFETRLTPESLPLAAGYPAVCAFVNDLLNREILEALHESGTRIVALRCAGFNNVDLRAADESEIVVARVPGYSPWAVAEHAVGLLLTLNRKFHRAYNRVREGNFSLDGLLGWDIHGQTVGVMGTGKIGSCFAQIMHGFGCEVLAHDLFPNPDCEALGVEYVSREELYHRSAIISLHMPLTPETHHLIDAEALGRMQDGVTIINTSRGALVDTRAVIDALKSGKIGHLGLDVYEEESDLFFEDLSGYVIQDDVFARLLTFPNVLITGHQAFFTRQALEVIAETTLRNIRSFEETGTVPSENEVSAERFLKTA